MEVECTLKMIFKRLILDVIVKVESTPWITCTLNIKAVKIWEVKERK